MREVLENLEKALQHADQARHPLASRDKTFHNRVLVKIVDAARLDLSSALTMLRGEKEETCEKS